MKIASQFTLVVVIALLMAACAGPHRMKAHHGGEMRSSAEKRVKQVMEVVEQAIQDPEKVKRIKARLSDIAEEVRHSYKTTRAYHRGLYELNTNYEATPEDFTKILDELNANRMRTGARILRMRFDIKEMLTAQEWAVLNEGFKALRSRYQHRGKGAHGKADGY